MFKRFVLWICVAAVFVSSCFVVVSAEDREVNGMTVVNYMDYIVGYNIMNVSDGWALINFGPDMFTSYKSDKNGTAFDSKGNRAWILEIPMGGELSYVTSQVPGGGENSTFLDLSNVPDGSNFRIQAIADFDNMNGAQTDVEITLFSGIKYYDEDFVYISGYHNDELEFILEGPDDSTRFSQEVTIPVDKPDGAVYAVLYSRAEFRVIRTNDVSLKSLRAEVQFDQPNLQISTSYTQILLSALINAKLPPGHSTVIGVDELESLLNGSLQDGMESAEDVFQSSGDLIADFLSGFTFMKIAFSSLFNVRFIDSLMIVSLSLGLFGFLVNTGTSIGRALERKTGKGGGK